MTLAVIPVGALAEAKRRLSPVLSEENRAGLVLAMLEDVLAACRGAESIERIAVVTPDPSLAPAGVTVLSDPGQGHAAAISLALETAPADTAVIVMADCPLVSASALDRLVAAARPVALAPAQDGGTNALAMRPAGVVSPAFGLPNGAALVVERTRAAGFEAAVIADPGLALDVDTLEDLTRVCELGQGTRTREFIVASGLLDGLRPSGAGDRAG